MRSYTTDILIAEIKYGIFAVNRGRKRNRNGKLNIVLAETLVFCTQSINQLLALAGCKNIRFGSNIHYMTMTIRR